MSKIARVYGKADDFDIEFVRKGDRWAVEIPQDLSDGRYVVRITAVDVAGNACYWIGELYMMNSVCHMKIKRHRTGCFFSAETYRMNTSVPHRMEFSSKKYGIYFKKNHGMVLKSEERGPYVMRFSVCDSIGFSKATRTDFSTKRISFKGDEKKMLMRKCSSLSIGKECSHV